MLVGLRGFKSPSILFKTKVTAFNTQEYEQEIPMSIIVDAGMDAIDPSLQQQGQKLVSLAHLCCFRNGPLMPVRPCCCRGGCCWPTPAAIGMDEHQWPIPEVTMRGGATDAHPCYCRDEPLVPIHSCCCRGGCCWPTPAAKEMDKHQWPITEVTMR